MLARLLLGEGGGQVLVRYDGPHGRHLGRREEPGAGPGEQGDHQEVRDGQRSGHAGRDERRVEQDAGAAGRAHEPQPVHPVGEHPGGQQHRDHPEQVQRLGRRGESAEPVSA